MPESIRDENTGITINVNEDGSINIRTVSYTTLTDFDSGNFPIYIGEALPGTKTSVTSWRIQKRTYTDNKLTAIEWANGTDDFNKEWDERTSYSYS